MATLKANGKYIIFTARRHWASSPAKEVLIMANGAGLVRRGGRFKKVRTVAMSKGMSFVDIARKFTDAGYAVEWHLPENTKRTPTPRRAAFGSSTFYAR